MWHKQIGCPKLSFVDCAASEGVEVCLKDKPVGQ